MLSREMPSSSNSSGFSCRGVISSWLKASVATSAPFVPDARAYPPPRRRLRCRVQRSGGLRPALRQTRLVGLDRSRTRHTTRTTVLLRDSLVPSREEGGGRHAIRSSSAAVRLRGARAVHRRADDAPAPRQAPSGLRG